MKKILPFLLLCCSGFSLIAQTVLENNPPSLKWYQVNTRNFRVIFPKGFDDQALRVANTLEHIRIAEAKSLGSYPRKISIILQNQSAISNGFVSVLPRRSEFYAMPSQDYNFTGTNDWLDMLAAHEYRHVVQYQHAMRGFNRVVYYFFGATTLAGMSHVAAPSWFWEGDAVATETAFTPSGRGKIPYFGLVFRTNLLEGREFNYHKQSLQSYKHNIPDHYVFGYHMVSYLRKRTNDPDIWGKITARSWSVPFIPFAFSNAIKKESGLYVSELYREMASSLKKEWKEELDQLELTPFEKVNARINNAYTDYRFPQPLADGRILVMKSGIGDIDQFVLLDGNDEKKAFTPGSVNDSGMISAATSTIVWNEYGLDPRWSVRNYSLVKAYDVKKKKKNIVGGRRSRYTSAAISPDETKVTAVRTGTDYKTQLVVMNFPEGKILKEFANPENHFYSMPRWSDDGKKIVVLKTGDDGKTISVIDATSNEEKNVLPYSHENVGYPVLYQQYLLFNSPVSGIDNIYAIDLNNNQRFQITTSKYGAYNPAVSPDGKILYYNDQSRNGLDVVKIPFSPDSWKPYKETKDAADDYQHLVEQEGRPGLFDSIPQQDLPVTRYSRLRGILNPYNWGVVINEDLTRIDAGISSRDILSTVNLTAGYTYDINERTGFWYAGISYQGLYPIIDVNFKQGKRTVDKGSGYDVTHMFISRQGDTTLTTTDQSVKLEWTERNLEAGLRLPLNFTRSKYRSQVSIANYIGYTQISDFTNAVNSERYVPALIRHDTIMQNSQLLARTATLSVYPFLDYLADGNFIYNHFSLSANHLLKRSKRDINSRWGQSLFLNYYSMPFKGDLEGGLFSVLGYLYLPGIFKHHSLWGYGAYQQTMVSLDLGEALDDYFFRNTVPLPRGLDINRFQKFYSMSVNYTMPVWYPDIALGPIVNFQRIRSNVFLDYAYGQSRYFDGSPDSYMSVGGELKCDLNIFRFLPRLNIGVRYSYGIWPSTTKFEFLLGTFNF